MSLIKIFFSKLFPEAQANNKAIMENWEKMGKPVPPPHLVKQNSIITIQNKLKYNVFIETGTYLGEMVYAQKNNFKHIYSIELGNQLFLDAVAKFKNKKNIKILHGDSGDALINLCKQINEPAIFWLDGHYSEGITAKGKKACPIFEELTAIFNSPFLQHVLLIDDARLFVGENDYPTINELTSFIKKHRSLSEIYIEDDIIKVFIKCP